MLIVKLARFLTHIFFSRVDVINSGRVPATGPVIVVANHHSALVDPMVLLATLERRPRFMAKAVLWSRRYLPIRPLLAAAKAVPVHRVKDGGGDNSAMFASTRDVLTDGGMIAVFGEGVSHDDPGLKEMKTGPARIALGAEGKTTIVPIGLIFPDRPRYRSTVTVAIGTPIEVHGSAGGDENRDEVMQLTTRISDHLGSVAPTWDRQDDQYAAYAAAKVVSARNSLDEGSVLNQINRGVDLADPVSREVLDAAKDLLDECQHLDVELKHVVEDQSNLGTLARTSYLKSIIWATPTILGHLINYPAYLACHLIAKRNDFNFQATAKLLAGIVLYPVWWAILFFAVWWQASFWWALGAFVVATVGGYIAGSKMHMLKTSNARMAVEDSDTDLSGLEQRFNAVVAAVDRLPA